MSSQIVTATPVTDAVAVVTGSVDAVPQQPPSSTVVSATAVPATAVPAGAAAAEDQTPSKPFLPKPPSLTLTTGQTDKTTGLTDILVSISTPENDRCPSDVVCVVDVSGSMATSATVQTTAGVVGEDVGLTVLDITKHAVRTIIQSLSPGDKFSLVSYSNKATVCLQPTAMDAAGKAAANVELNKLQPGGGTNLWDGLFNGLEQVRTQIHPSRNSAVLLLTDGQPNVVPPRGHQAMLDRYKDANPDLRCSISTFGFGYNLDSELLNDLAVAGQGQFSFIPDAGFVGTTFVHAVSNILSTMARRVLIKVSNDDDNGYGNTAQTETGDLLSGLGRSVTYPSWGIQIEASNLTSGQTKDIVVRTSAPGSMFVTLQVENCGTVQAIEMTAEPVPASAGSSAAVQAQINRLKLVDMIGTTCNLMAINNESEAQALVATFGAELERQINESTAADAATVGLKDDVTGQVTQAVSRRDWFTKWGRHYLPSLAQAHRLQQCNNFKDPGVQMYGGKLFNTIRDECDNIFMQLPPPTPSGTRGYGAGGSGQPRFKTLTAGRGGGGSSTRGVAAARAAAAPTPTVDISRYYDRNCGCFHGESTATLESGDTIKVQEVRQGMRVRVDRLNPKTTAKVLCVVQTKMGDSQSAHLTRLPSGCLLTPYHPVKLNGEWKFPIDVDGAMTKAGMVACGAVFSFVLENRGSQVLINGDECITLGHSLTGPVAGHPYFGSDAVRKDLEACKGWARGHIVFSPNPLQRDPASGLLTKYSISQEIVA